MSSSRLLWLLLLVLIAHSGSRILWLLAGRSPAVAAAGGSLARGLLGARHARWLAQRRSRRLRSSSCSPRLQRTRRPRRWRQSARLPRPLGCFFVFALCAEVFEIGRDYFSRDEQFTALVAAPSGTDSAKRFSASVVPYLGASTNPHAHLQFVNTGCTEKLGVLVARAR